MISHGDLPWDLWHDGWLLFLERQKVQRNEMLAVGSRKRDTVS
jgi:hypothetical protein